MEPKATMEEYCQYLTYTVFALVRRLGGEVAISPEEIYEAMTGDGEIGRLGELLTIQVRDLPEGQR